MTISISDDSEIRLTAEAKRRGINADQLVEQLIDANFPKANASKPNQASIDILNAWETETATSDPEEIARRENEFEQFKANLNETRRMTDGASARIPFP